jgi:uncharacterized protein (DUF885 family)
MTPTRREWLAGAGAAMLWPDAAWGREEFAAALRRRAGAVTPEQARRRLMVEHRRLSAQVLRLAAALRLPAAARAGTGAIFTSLFADERHLYPDSDAGRARAIADMNATLAQCRATLPSVVDSPPAEALNVAVRALSPAEIAAGRGGFREPAEPGRAGAYVVDLKDIRRRPRWTLPSVVAHELLPGHFLQMAFATDAAPIDPVFAEGWATYAETLIAYPDPLDALGHLHWLMFRVGRGLADLGIHIGGWSVAEARARLISWQGEPVYFAAFDTDLARITREPALRATEAVLWLAIADGARGRTGAALRAYHRTILSGQRPIMGRSA